MDIVKIGLVPDCPRLGFNMSLSLQKQSLRQQDINYKADTSIIPT